MSGETAHDVASSTKDFLGLLNSLVLIISTLCVKFEMTFEYIQDITHNYTHMWASLVTSTFGYLLVIDWATLR